MEQVGLKHAERILLKEQELELKFRDIKETEYTYQVSVENVLGEGSSCICYAVTVYKGEDEVGQKRILKQFYPDPQLYELDIEMHGISLDIKGYQQNEQVQELGNVFEKTYDMQIELAKKLPSIIVKPDMNHFAGSTKYMLFDSDGGETPAPELFDGIEEMIAFFYEFAMALEKLHGEKIIHMDLKPENILWVDRKHVKFFDFDASVDLHALETVHTIRADSEHVELLAPELHDLSEFEQNKKDFLTPRVDIYSFGAILFSFLFQRYPTMEDCNNRAYEEELYQYYNCDACRGKLTEEEQKMLNRIIWKCIQSDLSVKGRYMRTEDLVKELRQLYHSVNSPITERRKEFQIVNTRLQAAYLMDRYPLTAYRRKKKDGTFVLDVLIAGDDAICDEFFKNIYACTQMLDTELIIRLASKNAAQRMQRWIEAWPLLLKTTTVFLNDTKIKGELEPLITKEAFAKLYFYEWDSETEALKHLYKRINPTSAQTAWLIVAGVEQAQNMEQAKGLADEWSDCSEQMFIGYLDERGDGYDLRTVSPISEKICLVPFSNNNKYTIDESEFTKGIRGQALQLHKYYMRDYLERANKRQIWNDFSSSSYNVISSVCSVLSIPYKLESVGIRAKGKQAAELFYHQVLSNREETQWNQLIYLEHRRWICFMVTEGYDRPSNTVLERYAFVGENDQRNKKDKLHPMISDSFVESGIALKHLPHQKWKDTSLLKDESFDELDKMSLRIHQLCDRKIKRMSLEDGELKEIFDALEREMGYEKFSGKEMQVLYTMKQICQRMLNEESNIQFAWEQICAKFQELFRQKHKNSKALESFQHLKNSMRIVSERNIYHDYKSSDRTILEAIPLILTSDNPIRRIHKPIGEKTWQNIVSTLILEPEELILYATDTEQIDRQAIQQFLTKERGLFTKVIVRSWEKLQMLKVTKKSVKSVIDITGIKPEQAFELASRKNLNELPVMVFENGKLKSIKSKSGTNGYSEVEYSHAIQRHLTVQETFRLFHANVSSDSQENLMLNLKENYKNLWNAYLHMNSFRWKMLIDFLKTAEQKNYWPIQKKEATSKITKQYLIPKRQIVDARMDKLIRELKDKQLLERYQFPENQQTGSLLVETKYEEIAQFFDTMIQKTKEYPYLHQFYLVETKRNLWNGEPLREVKYYIKDDTLVVDETFLDCEVEDNQKQKKSELLQCALETLEAENKEQFQTIIKWNQAPLLEILEDKEDKEEEKKKNRVRVRFLYKNEATKECLMKEGNILEAYVYHTIWEHALVDDVKMNVSFVWDAENEEESLADGAIMNEIDLICTKNLQTYFISCKQSAPKTEFLQEIKYFADYFGVEGKAILICSNWQTGGNIKDQRLLRIAQLIENRSKKMEVYYINREMMGTECSDTEQCNLANYIQNIIDGIENWKDI